MQLHHEALGGSTVELPEHPGPARYFLPELVAAFDEDGGRAHQACKSAETSSRPPRYTRRGPVLRPRPEPTLIIVAGKIHVVVGRRDEFIDASREAIGIARSSHGCIDFAVSSDAIDENRVNIFEQWDSRHSLHAFRGAGPGADLSSLIDSIDVAEYEVAGA